MSLDSSLKESYYVLRDSLIDDSYRDELKERLTVTFSKNKILDVGCGVGKSTLSIARQSCLYGVYGVDNSKECIDHALAEREKVDDGDLRENIRFYCCDVCNLRDCDGVKVEDNFFNWVTSVYGLGSIDDLESGLNEIKRVCEPYSQFAFLEMTEVSEKYPLKRFFHCNFIEPVVSFLFKHSYVDFDSVLESSGFRVSKRKKLDNKIFGSSTLVFGQVIKDI